MRLILRKADNPEINNYLGSMWFKNAQSWEKYLNVKTEEVRKLAEERYKICLENARRFLGFYSVEDMFAYKELYGDF